MKQSLVAVIAVSMRGLRNKKNLQGLCSRVFSHLFTALKQGFNYIFVIRQKLYFLCYL